MRKKTLPAQERVTTMAKAALLKGVYNLNPTRMLFKQGQLNQRIATTSDVRGFKKVKPPKATKTKRKTK